jgi:hypothetical protein
MVVAESLSVHHVFTSRDALDDFAGRIRLLRGAVKCSTTNREARKIKALPKPYSL